MILALCTPIMVRAHQHVQQSQSKPYLLTHCGVLKIEYNHNHPIHAAHVLSFRDVTNETKKEFVNLFDLGHNASSARHAYEQELLLHQDSDTGIQTMLADRAFNPNPQDICRLYDKWRKGTYGNDNGKGLFEKLQEDIDTYNESNQHEGGKAVLQWYKNMKYTKAESDDDVNDDMIPPKPKKHKREESETP